MRRPFGKSLRLGVTRDALSLVQTGRWGSPVVLAEQPFDDGADCLASALDVLLGTSYNRWPVSIVVADDMARIWQVTPPPTATRMADLEAAATLRFQQLYGGSASSWSIRADWSVAAPFIAAALPNELLAVLGRACQVRRMPLVGIAPQFLLTCNTWHSRVAPGTWLGMVHDRTLTLGVVNAGRLVHVRATAIPDAVLFGWLEAHVARESLLLGGETPTGITLCGQVPPAWEEGTTQLACTVLGKVNAGSAASLLAMTGIAR